MTQEQQDGGAASNSASASNDVNRGKDKEEEEEESKVETKEKPIVKIERQEKDSEQRTRGELQPTVVVSSSGEPEEKKKNDDEPLIDAKGIEASLASIEQRAGPEAAGGSQIDSRQEAIELKILLDKAKVTIKELNTMLIRYEEENTSLRQYMEGMTRQQQQHHGLKGKVDGPGTQADSIFPGVAPPRVVAPSQSFPPTMTGPSSNNMLDYSSGSERSSICSDAMTESRKRSRAEIGNVVAGYGAPGSGGVPGMYGQPRPSVLPPSLPGPKNYRKSCDFCTSTKIRCDGGKPRCENCQKRSINCHYSERKRPGPKINSYSSAGGGGSSSSLSEASRYETDSRSSLHHQSIPPDRGANLSFHHSAQGGRGGGGPPPNYPHMPPTPYLGGGGGGRPGQELMMMGRGGGALGAGGLPPPRLHITDHVEAAATLMAMPNLSMQQGGNNRNVNR